MPTAMPQASAASRPTTIIESWVSITFMATDPASVMVAGMERSTLPGPRVMTNICPMPTTTKNVAKVSAAVSTSPAPWPRVKAMVAIQTATAATNDQIQGLSRMRRAPFIAVSPPGR